MFTGLVADLGTVVAREGSQDGARLSIRTSLARELASGDSVAVNGVCLSAARVDGDSVMAEVMNETLSRTSLAEVQAGAQVNLELPLRASDRLGGHIVQGHVDGVGRVTDVGEDGFARRVWIEVPQGLARYIVEKGSVAVDGVSLTVAGRDADRFSVSLIPETLARTNLADATVGRQVNLEVDVVAKYVESLIGAADGSPAIHSEPPSRPSRQSPQETVTDSGRTA